MYFDGFFTATNSLKQQDLMAEMTTEEEKNLTF